MFSSRQCCRASLGSHSLICSTSSFVTSVGAVVENGPWMDLESVMLSAISPLEKDKYHDFTFHRYVKSNEQNKERNKIETDS